MRIRTKNILLFLGLSLIPLSVTGKFAYENGKQAIKKNLGLAFQQLAHAQIKNVESHLEDVYKNIARWSKMSLMQEVVIDDMNATIQSFLMDIKKENKEFTYLSVISPEGGVVASTLPEMLETDSRGALPESFNRYIKTGKPYVSDVHYSGISKAWEITFSFPIKAEFEKDKAVGVLLAGWNAATLSRMVRFSTGGEIKGSDKPNHFMLMRNDGLIIAAPEFEQQDVFKVNLIRKGLRSALLASQRHEGYLIEKDEHGAESLIGYDYARGRNDFPDLGWFGFVLANTDTALASIERLRIVTFSGGLIVTLIVIILSIVASRRLTTPLLKLSQAAEKVARGDFEARVSINSKDEFGQLAGAFNAMAENLQKTTVSKNKLQQAHRELAEREKILRQTFDELSSTHEELKNTQNQLLQSEKLASIGQLAAGVAHEINNPIGFISTNTEVLSQYLADYVKILEMGNRVNESLKREDLAGARAAAEEMARMEKEINLEYIVNDSRVLLQHNRKGLERVQKIVKDLNTFARQGRDEMEYAKIEDVIEGILNIAYNELKYKTKLEKNYGDTPPVRCNIQRLGQVFVNLIVNALQAIEGTGTIEIKTYQENGFVCVDVRDTGKGIPEANLKKIFDPFFTTKPVGEGTGLGLSVSYEIVKKHNGMITVASTPGAGTTFTVMLPVNSQEKEQNSEQRKPGPVY